MNDNDPQIIGAHADHVSPLVARQMDRRDGSTFQASPPPFKPSIFRNMCGAIVAAIETRMAKPYARNRNYGVGR